MGIKKNAFLRDMVRVCVAADKTLFDMLHNELEPVWAESGKNADRAVQIVLLNPAKYPMLNKPSFSKKNIVDVMSIAHDLAYRRAPDKFEEYYLKLQQKRYSPEIDVSADLKNITELLYPAFLEVLRGYEPSIFNICIAPGLEGKKIIYDIYAQDLSSEEKEEELYKAISKMWIKSYFLNVDKIRERINKLGPHYVRDASQIYNVIFSYLNSLDRGF
jgi:hypothetical protein